jgi:hypothetical protein
MNWELVIFDLFREHISSLQENLVIFPSLFRDLCDMLVANRLSILNRMIWLISLSSVILALMFSLF